MLLLLSVVVVESVVSEGNTSIRKEIAKVF